MTRDVRIKIEIDGASRDDVITLLEIKIAAWREAGWPDENSGGFDVKGPSYFFYLGKRPLSDRERIERLEQIVRD